MTWDAESNTLEVFFNGVLRQTLTLDLATTIFNGDPLVNWGWTGTTGGQTNAHSFCLVDAFYSTHLEAVTVVPEGPWQFCEGEDVTLIATPLPPSESASWVASGNADFTPPGTGSYGLFAQDAQGCPSHGSIDVEVLPSPGLSLLVDPDIVVCDGEALTLAASAQEDAEISWENELGATYEAFESDTYIVEATLGGCTESATVDVLFQDTPDIQFFHEGTEISGETNLCGNEVELVVVATEGGVAIWEGGGSSVLTIDNDGVFSASATANGCVANPESIQVHLLGLPNADISGSPSTLCWQESGVVSAALEDGVSVIGWTYPAGTSGLNEAGAGQYSLAITNENGCENTVSFDYVMLPPINTGLADPDPLCDDSAALLSVTGNVDDLTWNVGGSNPELLVVPSMGEGPFVATVTLGACTQSDTATVTWWPTPSIGVLPDTVSRCVLDPAFNFNWPNQSDAPIGAWVWTVNGNGASAGYSITEEGDYLIEVQDNATGCLDTHELHLNVLPNIGVDATVRDPLVCIGDSTLVEVEILGVQGTNPNELPFSLFWSTEGVFGLEQHVGVGEHVVTVTNACGTSADVVVVEDEYCGCNVWIPNAFTPDKDGLNDGFEIVSSCDWDVFQFSVFNRWGQLVWQTEDPDKAWDGGTTLLGQGQHFVPDGQYAYRLHYEYSEDGEVYTKDASGRIVVIR